MIQQVFVIYDRKSETYLGPLMAYHNDGHAMRDVAEAFGRADTTLGRYPEDYDLYHVGTWDDVLGGLDPVAPPRLVARGTGLRSTVMERRRLESQSMLGPVEQVQRPTIAGGVRSGDEGISA